MLCSQATASAGDRRTDGISRLVGAAEWQPAVLSTERAGTRRSTVVGGAHVISQTSPAAGLAAKRRSRKKTGILPRTMRLPTITRNAGATVLIHTDSQPCHGGKVKRGSQARKEAPRIVQSRSRSSVSSLSTSGVGTVTATGCGPEGRAPYSQQGRPIQHVLPEFRHIQALSWRRYVYLNLQTGCRLERIGDQARTLGFFQQALGLVLLPVFGYSQTDPQGEAGELSDLFDPVERANDLALERTPW